MTHMQPPPRLPQPQSVPRPLTRPGRDAPLTRTSGPERWIDLIFAARSAQGGVIRRNRYWIQREVGLDRFELEVRRRGFHMIEAGNQLIVICHNGPVRFLF